MKLNVYTEELVDGRVAARVLVDMEVVHEVVAGDKIGALAALSSMTEADLDEAMSVHVAVKSSLHAEGEKQRTSDVRRGLQLLREMDEGDN